MSEPTIKDTVTTTLADFTGDADGYATKAETALADASSDIKSKSMADKVPDIPGATASVGDGSSWSAPTPVTRPSSDLSGALDDADNIDDPDKYLDRPSDVVGEVTPFSDTIDLKRASDSSLGVDFDPVGTTYEPGTKPTLTTYTAPTVTVPTVKDAPEITAPDDVTLHNTDIPVFTKPTLPDLAVSISPASLPSLQDKYSYSEDPYSPEVLDELLTEIRSIIARRTLVPSWVWDGFWSRGAGNLKRQETAALMEARRYHASLGWDMPGAPQFAMEAEARTKSREAISELTRENVLQQAVAAREDFHKAMEMGLACEQLLHQAASQRAERLLKSAVEANNAGIAVYNAALQAYQITELQAKELLVKIDDLKLRGVQTELQAFETDLKRTGFVLEYDKAAVELYKAQWSGEETKAKAYAAYTDAIKSYVEAQKAAVDAYGIQVQSNNTILQGWNLEWDAYVKRLEPMKLKIEAHNARNSFFANRVQYYQAQGINERSRVEAEVETQKLGLAAAQQELERFKALWAGLQTRLEAITKVYATDAQVYQAQGQVEAARVGSIVNLYQADIAKANLDLQARIETAKNKLGYWSAELDAWVKWNGAVASTYAQLGGAAYSAANISLDASSRVGYDYNMSYNQSLGRDYRVSVDVRSDATSADIDPPTVPERTW